MICWGMMTLTKRSCLQVRRKVLHSGHLNITRHFLM
uniref:Uncharacterized protein n=1 Tax=Anguilla anguilla TaxID=7936 RepID=A0A0E9XEK7_ANGAN